MPRAGVTTEKVFAVAREIANREGFDQLSLGRIAAHFGIKTPSLYKHIKNLEAVHEELAVQGYAGICQAIRATDSAEPDVDPVLRFARAYRRFALENPGLYAATQPTHVNRGKAVQKAALELLELGFAVLRELNVPEQELISAARSWRSAIHGFVTLELAGGFGLPEELDKSFDYMIEHWLKGWE